MDTNDKVQICKVIAQAIMSDVQITDSEREFLFKLMDSYGLDAAQRKLVMARNFGDDAAAMAKELTGQESQDELLKELLEVIAVDGSIAPQERALVKRVGEAIGLGSDEVDFILQEEGFNTPDGRDQAS